MREDKSSAIAAVTVWILGMLVCIYASVTGSLYFMAVGLGMILGLGVLLAAYGLVTELRKIMTKHNKKEEIVKNE